MSHVTAEPPDPATAQSDHEPSGLRWYQGIPRYAWVVLAVAGLGWLFDTMDQNVFNLVRQPSVTDILRHSSGLTGAALDNAVKATGAWLTALFLLGWAAGGFGFGIMGDRIGRTRTLFWTILIYAGFTGLSGLAHTIPVYAACRFLTALGVGGEFAAGASLVAEAWPNRSRPMALGTLQALSAAGNMMAAVVTFSLSNLGWRYAYAVGAVPAALAVWIILTVREPERWQRARALADATGPPGSRELGNVAELFRDPALRRNTIAGVLLAAAGVGGLWGVAFFLPDLTGMVLKPLVAGLPRAAADAQLARWRSETFFIQQAGALLGMFSYAMLAERAGRKPALALFFVLAWCAVEGTFWGVHNLASACVWAFFLGYCALAPFSAYAVYFPELYPTRLRATGVGFCYNCARVVAAAAPFALGGLALYFHRATDPTFGFRMAASIVACVYAVGLVGLRLAPETRGQPLPE